MKSCEKYELLASLVLDGEADETERAELTAHLEVCPACRAYFEDIKRIHEALAQEEIVVPEGFSVHVMDRVRKTKQDRPEKNRKIIPFPHWRRWAALAACCAVVVLSVWAFREPGGWKENVTMYDAPRMAADTGGETAGPAAVAQEPEVFVANEDAAADGETPAEVMADTPAALSEEDIKQSKSAVRDGGKEDQCRLEGSSAQELSPETDEANAPFVDTVSGEEVNALPAPESAGMGLEEPKNNGQDSTEDGTEPEQLEDGNIQAEGSPMPSVSESLEGTEEPESPEEPEETVEPAETVEPVEVIGVPEPGILIAYGPAAQSWVEDVLGLEWAIGGSYPLTAEQYGDLLWTLDEAGESYTIAEGEEYCLMTE